MSHCITKSKSSIHALFLSKVFPKKDLESNLNGTFNFENVKTQNHHHHH